MKHSALAKLTGISAGLLSATLLFASDELQPAAQTGQDGQAAPQPTIAPGSKLASGVNDVIGMTRAQVSEDVIATYIQASGSVYNLKPADIVTLHQQGVSDRIVSLMLSQGHVAAPNTNPVVMVTPAPVEPMPVPTTGAQAATEGTGNTLFIPGQNAFEIAAAGVPAGYEPMSTVYVIPDTTRSGIGYRPVYSYYSSYRNYGCVSPVIRIGGGYHHRYYSFHHR